MDKHFRVGVLYLGETLTGVVVVAGAAAQAVVYLRQVTLLSVPVTALANGSKLAVDCLFAGALGNLGEAVVTVLSD